MGEVDAIQNLQGHEGVEIRAAKGTIQYKVTCRYSSCSTLQDSC